MFRKHFRFKRLALGLAFAAFALPVTSAAAASYYVDGGPAPVSLSTAAPSIVTSERSYGAPGPSPLYSPLVVQTKSSDGFNWQDAGIGASIAFGITLLLLTAVALGRRSRSGLDQPGLA